MPVHVDDEDVQRHVVLTELPDEVLELALVENVQRHLAMDPEGRSKLETILRAAVEVRKPSIFGELIIALTFIPILALEGIEGKMFGPLALTVLARTDVTEPDPASLVIPAQRFTFSLETTDTFTATVRVGNYVQTSDKVASVSDFVREVEAASAVELVVTVRAGTPACASRGKTARSSFWLWQRST